MGEVEKLFIINPIVYSRLKKYIWFEKDAQQKEEAVTIFWRLFLMEVYIDGFATSETEYVGERAFNKPIVDISILKNEEAVVFVECGFKENGFDICQSIVIVNPAVNKDNIVIFGAGNYGKIVYEQLTCRGLGKGIICFIDSDETKCNAGKSIEGLEIHDIDSLLNMDENVSIIEASQKHEEMENSLRIKGIVQKRFFYSEEHQCSDHLQFGIESLLTWCSTIWNKKIYYYGKRDRTAEKTGRCLQLMDFQFCGFLHDEIEDIAEVDDFIVEDILYDEGFFILIDQYHSQKGRTKLNELGLRVGIEYNLINRYSYFTNMDNLMLDLNLGYAYKEGEKYFGFAVYGEENEDDYKIVCLGASTTDANINWEKCWPCFLYEKLVLKNKVTIYNGGIAGYNSGQELIKLIRDALPLKPDLIIVYDGLIDIVIPDTDRPFAFSYLEKIFNCAKENMDMLDLDIESSTDIKIDLGVKSGKSAFENWISNIEIMSAIAKLRGIQFLSFVQPSRYYMMDKMKRVDSWFFSEITFWREGARRIYTNFRKELFNKKVVENHDYIIDLTGLFDDKAEVYMDAVHLYAEGNEIVAENIRNVINKKGLLK